MVNLLKFSHRSNEQRCFKKNRLDTEIATGVYGRRLKKNSLDLILIPWVLGINQIYKQPLQYFHHVSFLRAFGANVRQVRGNFVTSDGGMHGDVYCGLSLLTASVATQTKL